MVNLPPNDFDKIIGGIVLLFAAFTLDLYIQTWLLQKY